jgi:hypothetical protein
LEFIRRARVIDSNDPSLAYGEAIVDWLAGKQQDAMQHLEEALKKGYSLQAVQNDPELSKLQVFPEFAKITAQNPLKAD